MTSSTPRPWRRLAGVAVIVLMGALMAAPASAAPPATGDDLYVPPPDHGAKRQIADLTAQGDKEAADLIRAMIDTPQAVWFTAGTPASVKREVRSTVTRAVAKRTIPVLVAYNIPFRDCAQFSAGGATTQAEYEAWIDGFAAGIGDREAIVILEPDGLGIIPWYDPYGSADGSDALEWCQPAEADPATAAAERFAMLGYAVDALADLPHVTTYLDGTHSAWLGVGDIAHRLVQAGVADADGFFLNASNYQFTVNNEHYGGWISACIAYATEVAAGDFFGCPNQYWNGGPLPAKIAELLGEWTGVALSSFGEWSADADDPTLNTSGIDLRYSTMLGGVEPTYGYVIDTSRNGQGPWQPPAYPDPQDWCNPPDRGLGLPPTLDTGEPLVDAYLWIKIPGESDGECTRGLGPAGETIDPEWGRIDPAAGDWFPEMALELASNADPVLRP
ncbi:MAG TPA: glycoside hydrolase family 6 protein [Acidimicrobiales bacterium]|nr:glycoside hydrolase family 6 protein [Acidimicrobiales bacterium]